MPGRASLIPTPAVPSLAQLRALIVVADAGGFGEAAAEYGVSQSSLSEAVAKLEALAGRPLLRRTPGGTVPTEAGVRALTHARLAVQAATDALLASQEEEGLRGTLRVAAMRSSATHLLPPALAAFRSRHPGVTVTLFDAETCGGPDAIRCGQVDVGIVVAEDAPDLRLTPLLADEYLLAAPATRGAPPVTFAELEAWTLLLPPGRDSCHRRVRAYLEARGVVPSALMEVEQDSVTLSMVAHGLGVTIMPQLALEPLPPGLVAVPLPDPLWRSLALATLPHRSGLPLLRAFTQAVVAQLPTSG